MAAKFNLLIAAKTSGSAAIKRMGNSMQGLQGKLKNVGLSLGVVNRGFAALGLAVSGGAFAAMVKNAVNLGDSFGKLSTQTGIASNTLMAYVNAGKLAGVEQETIDKGLRRLAQSMREADQGVATYKDAFDALGLSVRNADGTLKSSEQVLGEISDEFKDMENGATKAALAMEILGRSGASLIPFLNMGAEGIKQFNFELSGEFAKNAEDFNDTMTRIGFSFQGANLQLVDKLLPTLNDLAISIEKFLNNKSNLESLFDSINTGLTNIIETTKTLNNIINAPGFKQILDLLYKFSTGPLNKLKDIGKVLEPKKPPSLSDQLNIKDPEQTGEFIGRYRDRVDNVNSSVKNLTGSVEKLNNQWKQGAQDGLTKYREGMKDIATRVSDMVVNSFKKMEDALLDFVTGGKLNFRDLANSIIKDMIRIQIQQSITGPLSSFIGSLFPGPKAPTTFSNRIAGRATGGPVSAGTSYLVGERGMEIFTPRTSGNITPNNKLGGTNVVVNVDASGTEVQGDEQQGRALGQLIAAAVQSELVQQSRPGGILNPA